MLMINVLWDNYIPRKATLEFWEACGKPGDTWFPAGHVSLWAWYPLVGWRVATFLGSHFTI